MAKKVVVKERIAEKIKEMEKEKVAEKEAEKAIKERISKAEERNYNKLMVYPSGENWWKMIDHSALIYKYIIAPELKISVNLNQDTDRYSTSKTGVVSIGNIEGLKKNLAKLGIKEPERFEGVWIFKLGKYGTTKEDLDAIVEAEEQRWQEATAVLVKKEVIPVVWRYLRELLQMAVNVARNAKEPMRSFIMMDVAEEAKKMMSDYIDYCNEKITIDQYEELVEQRTQEFSKKVRIALEVKMWDLKRAVKAQELIDEIKKTVRAKKLKRRKDI